MKESNMESAPNKIVTISQHVDMDTILEKLREAKIPVDEYGRGTAKTVEHLLSEINEGEAVLTIDQDGKTHRTVGVVWVDVFCALSNGKIYRLKEDRQEFKDGRVKVRNLDSSIGEKMKPSETTNEAIVRALSEELGIVDIETTYDSGYEERTSYTDTFPGIESTYKMHKFAAIIPETAFTADGYIENQHDKTNYYAWELIYNGNWP